MKQQTIQIAGIPALLCGEESPYVYLYIHGRQGCKEEAIAFAELACPAGYQVLAIDLPEHGERKNSAEKLLPWFVVRELQLVYQYAKCRWKQVSLRATSIGAWMAMLALADKPIKKALFVSPVTDMETLISKMMQWANVTEAQLQEAGEIPTAFGETLSWPYLCWVREHPLRWHTRTQALFGGDDNLTSREEMGAFRRKTGAHLTILAEGEHWFHTETQLAVLQEWEKKHL